MYFVCNQPLEWCLGGWRELPHHLQQAAGVWKEAGNKQPALNPNSKQLFAAGSGIGCEAVPAKRAVHGSCGAGLVSSRPSKLGVVQQLYFTMSMGLQPSLCITGIPPLAPSISTATSSKNPE